MALRCLVPLVYTCSAEYCQMHWSCFVKVEVITFKCVIDVTCRLSYSFREVSSWRQTESTWRSRCSEHFSSDYELYLRRSSCVGEPFSIFIAGFSGCWYYGAHFDILIVPHLSFPSPVLLAVGPTNISLSVPKSSNVFSCSAHQGQRVFRIRWVAPSTNRALRNSSLYNEL